MIKILIFKIKFLLQIINKKNKNKIIDYTYIKKISLKKKNDKKNFN